MLWIPLTYENNQLKYGGNTAQSTTKQGSGYANTDKWDTITEYTLPEGNYYLSGNITINGTITISGDVNLCLNGHTLSTNKVSYAVLYTQNNQLTICDCGENGCLQAPKNGVTNVIRSAASVTYTILSNEVANPTITVDGTYTYDGTAKTPSVTVKDGDKEIPSAEYSVSYANNTNAGTATVTITDVAGGNYNVCGSTTFTIDKATITVIPEAGQNKTYGDANDPMLEYSSVGAKNSEVPAFTGALSRTDGTNAGKYDITIGTLALTDKGSFKADNYELKLAETTVQFEIVPKTLTADDLEFTADSIFKKTYDKTTACTTARVQIRPGAIVDENDELPTVVGTYVYNSENVKDADKVIFTAEAASAQNYILPAGLTVENEAKIDKAAQSYLIITPTTVPYGIDFDLTTIVSGGSGTGEVTYSVTNGSGMATITGSRLFPGGIGARRCCNFQCYRWR